MNGSVLYKKVFRYFTILVLFSLLSMAAFHTEAYIGNNLSAIQSQISSECLDELQQLMSTIPIVCGGQQDGSLCLGAGKVQLADTTISQIGDKSLLVNQSLIQTSGGLNVVVLEGSASADTLRPPLFFLLGSVNMRAASAQNKSNLGSTLVTVIDDTPIFKSANPHSTLIEKATQGKLLNVDGRNGDTTWLRVVYPNGYGWIDRKEVFTDNPESLPIVSADILQDFTLLTGQETNCADQTLSRLVVVSHDKQMSIVVNGAKISFQGTIALETSADNSFELLLFRGNASVENRSLTSGSKSTSILDADGQTVAGSWNDPVAIDENARLFELVADQMLPFIQPTPIPTELEATPSCAVNTAWPIYTVYPNDTLSGIASRSGTTIQALLEANCLTNPNRLNVGQQLHVPRIPSPPPLPTLLPRPTSVPPPPTFVPLPTATEGGVIPQPTATEGGFMPLPTPTEGGFIPLPTSPN